MTDTVRAEIHLDSAIGSETGAENAEEFAVDAATVDGGVSHSDVPDADSSDPAEVETAAQDLPIVSAVEAILFVADKPVSAVGLASALQHPLDHIHAALAELTRRHEGGDSALEVREIAGGWRLYTKQSFDPAVAAFAGEEAAPRLSQAALETLAVIAYKQPISRGHIAAVRAVNVDSVVRTLVSRGLIQDVDVDAETGATLFGTTPLFLSKIGVNDLDELPPISPLLPDSTEPFDVY